MSPSSPMAASKGAAPSAAEADKGPSFKRDQGKRLPETLSASESSKAPSPLQLYFGKWRGVGEGLFPPRPTWNIVIWSFLGAFIGITASAALTYNAAISAGGVVKGAMLPFIIGSCGASAVLLYGTIDSPLAQPRNYIGGCLVSAIIGVGIAEACTALGIGYGQAGDHWLWFQCGLAVALSISVMQLLQCVHPPGGAIALIAVTATSQLRLNGLFIIAPVMASVVIMLFVALIVNNVQRQYPLYWWYPRVLDVPMMEPGGSTHHTSVGEAYAPHVIDIGRQLRRGEDGSLVWPCPSGGGSHHGVYLIRAEDLSGHFQRRVHSSLPGSPRGPQLDGGSMEGSMGRYRRPAGEAFTPQRLVILPCACSPGGSHHRTNTSACLDLGSHTRFSASEGTTPPSASQHSALRLRTESAPTAGHGQAHGPITGHNQPASRGSVCLPGKLVRSSTVDVVPDLEAALGCPEGTHVLAQTSSCVELSLIAGCAGGVQGLQGADGGDRTGSLAAGGVGQTGTVHVGSKEETGPFPAVGRGEETGLSGHSGGVGLRGTCRLEVEVRHGQTVRLEGALGTEERPLGGAWGSVERDGEPVQNLQFGNAPQAGEGAEGRQGVGKSGSAAVGEKEGEGGIEGRDQHMPRPGEAASQARNEVGGQRQSEVAGVALSGLTGPSAVPRQGQRSQSEPPEVAAESSGVIHGGGVVHGGNLIGQALRTRHRRATGGDQVQGSSPQERDSTLLHRWIGEGPGGELDAQPGQHGDVREPSRQQHRHHRYPHLHHHHHYIVGSADGTPRASDVEHGREGRSLSLSEKHHMAGE